MERGGIDSPLGSTAFGGAADLVLHLKRRTDGMRLLASVQRDGMDLPETVLQMDEETGLLSLAGSYAEVQLREVVEAMERVLEAGDERLTRVELFDRVEGPGQLKNDALKSLKGSGRLHIEGAGKRGDPLRYSLPKGYSRHSDASSSVSPQPGKNRLFSWSGDRLETREQEIGLAPESNGDGLPPPEDVSVDAKEPWDSYPTDGLE